ncbi:MAG TPA: CBS domain-containing protein [Bacteroidia bacterium]|nr:CBS domain-containing protein [Bacteroidia bacterium]
MLDGSEQSFVVTENGNVTGILTQKELVHGLSQDGKHTRVADVMRRDFLSLAPQMHLEDAMQKMLAAGQYLCPVMENGRLAGVIDLQNINEFILINGAIRKKEITGSGVSDE